MTWNRSSSASTTRSSMFESFPDFEAQLLRHTSDELTVWGEWHWRATGLNMAGVTVMGAEEDSLGWARLYMQPVEENGPDIDEAVQSMTEGVQRETDRCEEASPT